MKKSRDSAGRFDQLLSRAGPGPILAIADERVLQLHPHARRALEKKHITLVELKGGESAKSLGTLELLTRRALTLPRRLTLLAIGGGTIGDVATVFAHVFKRGVGRLIHVPTTLLAAVDSSVGGKGAVNVAGTKNVLGVFHFADEAWLCAEFFTTLTEAQRREGRIEAWKMVVTLDAKDPYETRGLRVVLNFGHTLGHAIESLSKYRVRHGEAVGLGMLYALDVGVRLGVTPAQVARDVEASLPLPRGARGQLAKWLAPSKLAAIREVIRADKKEGMILLRAPGRWMMTKGMPA